MGSLKSFPHSLRSPKQAFIVGCMFVWLAGMTQAATAITASSFRLPLEGEWNPGRTFGTMICERCPQFFCGFHLADDVPRQPDTVVFPTADGIVREARWIPENGYKVVIEHELPNGAFVTSIYFHMKVPRHGGIRWEPGQEVQSQNPLGFISGRSEDHGDSRPHLHFGIRRGPYNGEIDPRTEQRFHVGYSTIFRDGVRQCIPGSSIHTDILGEWEPPLPFIQAHAAQGNGTIQGVVFVRFEDDSFPPEALAGARVSVFLADSLDLLAVTETDADGRYAISLAPGTYFLAAFKAVDESTFFEGFADEPVILESGQVVEQNIEVVFIAPV